MTDATLLSSSYSHYAARAAAARPQIVAQVAALASAPLTRERIDARFDALCAEAAGAAADVPVERGCTQTGAYANCAPRYFAP